MSQHHDVTAGIDIGDRYSHLAHLKGAYVKGADLRKADLRRAILDKADLRGSTYLGIYRYTWLGGAP